MSFLFGDTKQPQVAPLPQGPSSADQEAARAAADSAAQAERATNGRRSTIVAGMKIADEGQQDKGVFAAKRRAAARELG